MEICIQPSLPDKVTYVLLKFHDFFELSNRWSHQPITLCDSKLYTKMEVERDTTLVMNKPGT